MRSSNLVFRTRSGRTKVSRRAATYAGPITLGRGCHIVSSLERGGPVSRGSATELLSAAGNNSYTHGWFLQRGEKHSTEGWAIHGHSWPFIHPHIWESPMESLLEGLPGLQTMDGPAHEIRKAFKSGNT